MTDYRYSPDKSAAYENRKPSNGNATRQIMQMRRSSNDRKEHSIERPNSGLGESRIRSSHSYEKAHKLKSSKASIISKKSYSRESLDKHDTGPTFRDPEIAKSQVPLNIHQNENEFFQPLKQEDQRLSTEESENKPERSPYDCEYDLTSSNKRMKNQAASIERESSKLCKGSEDPCANLVVTCIIRHPPAESTERSKSPV